jgi:hypothetical protein
MKIRRYTYDPQTQHLSSPVDVLTGLPHGTDHGGGRVVFGPDGKLYVSRGDQGSNFLANYCNRNRAQDLPTLAEVQAADWSTYQGKILRLNLDGSIPRDNPVLNGVRSHIYSYGHRNPQGLVFAGRRLFDSEHGESIDDEVNLVEAGGNYGWPLIAGYQDDQSYVYANWSASSPQPCASLKFDVFNPPASVPRQKESDAHVANFKPPAKTFFTMPNTYDLRTLGNATTAPAGMKVYSSPAIPGWHDSLLLTSMISGVVFRMPLLENPKSQTPNLKSQLGTPVAYFKTGQPLSGHRRRSRRSADLRRHGYARSDGRSVGRARAGSRQPGIASRIPIRSHRNVATRVGRAWLKTYFALAAAPKRSLRSAMNASGKAGDLKPVAIADEPNLHLTCACPAGGNLMKSGEARYLVECPIDPLRPTA